MKSFRICFVLNYIYICNEIKYIFKPIAILFYPELLLKTLLWIHLNVTLARYSLKRSLQFCRNHQHVWRHHVYFCRFHPFGVAASCFFIWPTKLLNNSSLKYKMSKMLFGHYDKINQKSLQPLKYWHINKILTLTLKMIEYTSDNYSFHYSTAEVNDLNAYARTSTFLRNQIYKDNMRFWHWVWTSFNNGY